MDVVDMNTFAYNNLDSAREQLKSEMLARPQVFDCDYANYLNMRLGCSSISNSSSSSSSDDDDDDCDNNGASGNSDGDGGCDVDVNGANEEEDDDDDEEEDEGLADTHLKMFLENITADGTSYVLKREGRPDLKFEGMDDDDDDDGFEVNVVDDQEELSGDCERRRRGNDLDVRSEGTRDKGVLRAGGLGKSRNGKGNGKVERRSKGVNNVGKKLTFRDNNKYTPVEEVDLTQVKRREKSVKNADKQKCFVGNESDSSVKEVDIRLDGSRFSKNAEEIGKLKRKANNAKNVEKQKKKRCLSENISNEDFDHEYKMFFDQCELEGDRLILVANGMRLIYGEGDSESLSDSDEICVLDHAPDCIESGYAPTLNFDAQMEDDDLQCLGSCNAAENPLFRKAVMDILRKPFNYKEYGRLREDVKQRKLVERHVDMRSGNTSFQQSTMGKSYLDHYADLKKQLVAFKNDTPKKLNILRGFFFYLERMADDGKFKPWLDDSCLAIIPGTG